MSLFKKASELTEKKTISILIYGQPGSGKSSMAVSAPGPVVVFDFDGGIRRVNAAHRAETITVEINEWKDVEEAMKSEEMAQFKTIVIDTAGKMLSFMDKYIIAKSRDKNPVRSLTLNEYGIRKTMFNNFVQQSMTMGKNVVFIAHDREEKDGEIRKVRPEVGGSSAGDLIKELDLVGYLELIGNERVISFTPCERFYAKNACNLPPAFKVPVILDDHGNMMKDSRGRVIRNTFLTDIIKTHMMSQSERMEKLSMYDTLKEIINDKIATVTDADSANEIAEDLASLEVIFDSELYGKQRLYSKCISLGLKWNKLTSKYESCEKKEDKKPEAAQVAGKEEVRNQQ